MTGTKILKQEKLRPKLTSSIDNVTVNSEINACIYYCDFMKTVQNVILLNAHYKFCVRLRIVLFL